MHISPITSTTQALDDAMTLGIAQGIMMVDFTVGRDTAHGMLRCAGEGTGRSAVEVARAYVTRAAQRA